MNRRERMKQKLLIEQNDLLTAQGYIRSAIQHLPFNHDMQEAFVGLNEALFKTKEALTENEQKMGELE